MTGVLGVGLWDVESKKEVGLFFVGQRNNYNDFIVETVFSPDGKFIAACSPKRIYIWSVYDQALLRTFYGHTDKITSIDFSSDGTRVVTGAFDNTAKIWNVSNEQRSPTELEKENDSIEFISFAPDGTKAVVITKDEHILLVKVEDCSIIFDESYASRVADAAGVPDDIRADNIAWSSAQIWIFMNDKIGVGRSDAGNKTPENSKYVSSINSAICLSPDGTQLAIGTIDEEVSIWNPQKSQQITDLKGHKGTITHLEFSPDGKFLVSGSTDGTARIWDAQTYQCRMVLRGHIGGVTSLSISIDANIVATGTLNGTIYLWSLQTGGKLGQLSWHSLPVSSMCFSPDGYFLIAGDRQGMMSLWDIKQLGKYILRTIYPACL